MSAVVEVASLAGLSAGDMGLRMGVRGTKVVFSEPCDTYFAVKINIGSFNEVFICLLCPRRTLVIIKCLDLK